MEGKKDEDMTEATQQDSKDNGKAHLTSKTNISHDEDEESSCDADTDEECGEQMLDQAFESAVSEAEEPRKGKEKIPSLNIDERKAVRRVVGKKQILRAEKARARLIDEIEEIAAQNGIETQVDDYEEFTMRDLLEMRSELASYAADSLYKLVHLGCGAAELLSKTDSIKSASGGITLKGLFMKLEEDHEAQRRLKGRLGKVYMRNRPRFKALDNEYTQLGLEIFSIVKEVVTLNVKKRSEDTSGEH
jgi:hypothetical protein